MQTEHCQLLNLAICLMGDNVVWWKSSQALDLIPCFATHVIWGKLIILSELYL